MIRNLTLDYTKVILSLFVVVIHSPIFWEFRFPSHLLFNGIARVAVPCFFILNGLYVAKAIENPENLKKYLKKVGQFYVVWMLIYAPFYLKGVEFNTIDTILLTLECIFFGFWHLWYLVGIIGGVFMLFILKRYQFTDKRLLIAAIILFLIGWGLQKIELFYPNVEGLFGSIIRSNAPSRNFIFMGFPFITMGYLISKGKLVFLPRKKKTIFFFLLFSILLLLTESIAHFLIIGRRGFDFYLAIIIFCPLLIAYIKENSKKIQVKTDNIAKMSAVIYFIHPLALFWVRDFFPELNGTMRYPIIVVFSVITGFVLIPLNRYLKIFF